MPYWHTLNAFSSLCQTFSIDFDQSDKLLYGKYSGIDRHFKGKLGDHRVKSCSHYYLSVILHAK